MKKADTQLELFAEDDSLSWDEWFRALPLTPESKARVHRLPDEEQLTLEQAA